MSVRVPVHRRTVLRTAASIALLAVPGCGALGDDEPDAATPSEQASGTATPMATERPATDPTPSDDEADVEQLKARSREFLDLLGAGKFETANERFAEPVRGDYTADYLSQVWTNVEEDNGEYGGVVAVEHTTEGGYDLVYVTADFTSGRQSFRLTFSDGDLYAFFLEQSGTT